MAPMKKKKQSDAERLQKKRESEKRRQQRIKSDPELFKKEQDKWKAKYRTRKEKGQIKLAKDMNKRDLRHARKVWREKKKNQRATQKRNAEFAQYLEINSPAESDEDSTEPVTPKIMPVSDSSAGPSSNKKCMGEKVDGRKLSGEKRRRRNLGKAHKDLKKIQDNLEQCKRKMGKYKKRYQRLMKEQTTKSPKNTPKSKVNRFLKGRRVDDAIRKKLLFGEIVQTELAKHYSNLKLSKDKRYLKKILSCKILKKYRILTATNKLLHCASDSKLSYTSNKRNVVAASNKMEIRKFLESDENSTIIAPGKRDTITKNKLKMQKRYLNDSLYSLHKKYTTKYGRRISYSLFCRLKPFWVVVPNVNKRDTCLCLKHSNFEMMLTSLYKKQIVKHNSTNDLLTSITCVTLNENCLLRKCSKCEPNKVKYNFDVSGTGQITYHKWISLKEKRIIKNQEKHVQITKKVEYTVSFKQAVNEFEKSLPIFMKHLASIVHQRNFIYELKKSMPDTEILFHIDFSENFCCKYFEEVQSIHFGASRSQITIHTGVAYFFQDGILQTVSFATLSESLRHDPPAIWAHLHPVISHFLTINPRIKTIHFLSDSPTSQYRNKTNFYLFETISERYPAIEKGSWNFSEAGHGKGAPDGVGAVIKRTADRMIAEGNDVTDADILFEKVQKAITSVTMWKISSDEIKEIEKYLPSQELETVEGTMSVHQLTFQKEEESIKKDFRTWSCSTCSQSSSCQHFPLKPKKDKPLIRKAKTSTAGPSKSHKTKLVYQDSDEETLEMMAQRIEEEEKEDEEEVRSAKVGAWVLVKFTTKKTIKHFIGQIIELNKENDDYVVKFVKKCGRSSFQWPDIEDLSVVTRGDIEIVLPEPKPDRRGEKVIFKMEFDGYDVQ